ncbi:MAG: hypothetical protein IT377_26715 [Polyangiaceae bacterium]|nr:hypothetical protein [Polyangiaceae bacterium]
MHRWPEVDPAVRRRLLDEMRRRQNREAGQLTPAARLARLDDLVELVRALDRRPPGRSDSDEPHDVLRRMKRRFREADGRE